MTQTNVFINRDYWRQFWHHISFSVFGIRLFIIISCVISNRLLFMNWPNVKLTTLLLSWGLKLEAIHFSIILIRSERVLITKSSIFIQCRFPKRKIRVENMNKVDTNTETTIPNDRIAIECYVSKNPSSKSNSHHFLSLVQNNILIQNDMESRKSKKQFIFQWDDRAKSVAFSTNISI